MKKYISLMNTYSFYYLWDSEYKHYLENVIKEIINQDEEFKLIETFNNTNNYLRSYIFLESENNLIYIDFNKNESNQVFDNALIIFNYLQITSDKNINLIIFNSFKGINTNINNIYQIYKNDSNNNFLKLLFSNNFKEQSKSNFKNIIDYLYNLDQNFYLGYLKEEKLKENIYKSPNL